MLVVDYLAEAMLFPLYLFMFYFASGRIVMGLFGKTVPKTIGGYPSKVQTIFLCVCPLRYITMKRVDQRFLFQMQRIFEHFARVAK